jgi:biopolymer transport protein TolQ
MKNAFLLPLLVGQSEGALNPIDLILDAGWVVKAVMLLLLIASIVSWTIIFWKWWLLRDAARENQRFAEAFWTAGSLDAASRAAQAHPKASLTRVFESGLHEFNQVNELNLNRDETIELLESNVTRSLDKAVKIETEGLQRNVGFLANTASAAPFIGLFGTVWGIMNSFINIGATGASNLAVVAPGIAEALIATAMGLFAAIPAVLFYNYFVGFIKVMSSSMRHFTTDFLNTAKRSV